MNETITANQSTERKGASRRRFIKMVGAAGAGLTLGITLSPLAACLTDAGKNTVFAPNAFIRIGTDNIVTLVIKHLEMGQGSFTGLATLMAEELDADWAQIKTEAAPADVGSYKNRLFGVQGTGGSSAIAESFEQMRQAGATARAMLVSAAASQWEVDPGSVNVHKGNVFHKASGRQSTFGELAAAAARQPIPAADTLKLKAPKDFVYIGTKVSRKDTGKTDGSAIFTQDIKLAGMLTAVVAHPPRFGARLASVNDKKARGLKGVVDVVRIPDAVAVLARDFWTAKKARDLLEIQWDESQAFKQSSNAVMARFKTLADKPGLSARNDGDADQALGQLETVLEATYEFPFLAHAAMEPMNCAVRVDEKGCELWYGAQLHTTDQQAVANTLGIKPEQVKINTLYAGGSFGRRGNPHSDYVLEATHIAKARPGTPIKLVWTREDDTRAGHYRPMYVHKIRAGLDKKGNPVAWKQRIVGQSIMAGTALEPFVVKEGIDPSSVEGASQLPYHIPNLAVELHTVDLGVPVQWWRSVGHTHTAFSTETFIDELAYAAKKDPVEFRLQLLKNHPRHRGVLELAAQKAGWGTPLPKGWGRGVAVHESFNSCVAEVAEVSVHSAGHFKVERVVCAVDCGFAVNPDVIKAQMESGIGYGLSPALMSAITLKDGRVVQSNFHDYQVLRFGNMPAIDVHIVPSAQPPTGVGEPGTPPVAAAVANALFAATGKRQHQLPLRLS